MPLLWQSLELTRQRAEPPLLQLAFDRWVLISEVDVRHSIRSIDVEVRGILKVLRGPSEERLRLSNRAFFL